MIVTPAEGQERFRSYVVGFRLAVLRAWGDVQRYFGPEIGLQSTRAKANVMHDRVVHHLRVMFDGDPDVTIRKFRGLWLMYIGGRSRLKMKKLDRNLLAINIHTRQSELFNCQQPMLDGMPPEADNFVLGYRLDSLGLAVQGIFVTYPQGDGIG